MKSKFRLSCMAMLASAAMSSLGSCSSDELLDGINTLPENAIAFNVTQQGALSRGTETNSGNFQNQIKDFQVWAYFDKAATGTGVTPGGLYVGDSHTIGTKVNGDTKGAWSYDDVTKQQYWPATTAPLNFQAITPYAHSSFTIENTPDVADPKLAHVTANVTVPTTVADQQDIMFAKADGQTRETNSQTVGLNFQHGMSQVVFSGKLASDKIEATVHGIEIHNLHNTGKVGYMGTNAELQAQTTGVAGTTFAAGLVDNPVVNSSSQATVLSAADGALFMLPQTVAKWTTTAKNPVPTSEADANHNSYLKVTCTVKDKASGVVLVNNGSIYIPLEVNWQQGKKYSYTLVFGQGEQGFKPDGSHDDNLLQIKYSVSAENWNAAGNEDLGMGGGFEKPDKKNKYVLEIDLSLYGTPPSRSASRSFTSNVQGFTGTIDWGDGTVTTHKNADNPNHEYSSVGKYTVIHSGTATSLSYFMLDSDGYPINDGPISESSRYIVSVNSIEKYFGQDLKHLTGAFLFSSLTSIPENIFANCPNILSFLVTFEGCSALTTIPENLFANCPKVTVFGATFSECTALIAIPKGLFVHNPKVTIFQATFWGCTSLKSIPTSLFDNNRKVTSFSETFYNCSDLTGESPYTMIGDQKVHLYERANYPEHFTTPTDFLDCFYDCTGLTDYAQIPTNWK